VGRPLHHRDSEVAPELFGIDAKDSMVASGWVGRCGVVSDGYDPAVFGQILTRTWVVDLMLDGLNYVEGSGLADKRIVDAGAGKGAFLFPIIDRLMDDAKRSSPSMATLSESLIAVSRENEVANCGVRFTVSQRPKPLLLS
jgi:hypothetical protein